MLRRAASACACAVILLLTAGTPQAQTFDRTTYFTFTETVMLPGMTLPAGTYRFSLVDDSTSRQVVRVSNREGTQTFGLIQTIGTNRPVPSDEPELHFLESRSGTPLPIKRWWYPGDTLGREFVYSDEEEMRMASGGEMGVMRGTR